ncbi:DExH-box splicing factor binding site family protein [Babesia bovis T2Bo]|uniref:Spp2/MOS2 G-patch domain-containing protein n=1 Tax=Babesia bovis TaxID=5865 RepID=A7AWB1_BABBO|nr:DExH-box splicing factor binding site family protein [Babesia bovis T2Bo]EDO05339.1 DExH-box splicing factor binding site family protein [Babesia bovis T2Bo]|eukprot:XP_001608907.1 hypothetical protein [Babesia bovis T2Bo]
MKISFGISKPSAKQPPATRVLAPKATHFFEADDPAAPSVERVKVTEIAGNCMQIVKDGVSVSRSLVEDPTLSHSVIPCTNRLDKNDKSTTQIGPIDLKYGLNVIPKTDSSRDAAQSTGTTTVTNAVPSPVEATDIPSEPEPTSTDQSISTKGESNEALGAEDHTDISDAEVARLILHDQEQQKLREQLFGTDLIEQASNTVPILLRGKRDHEDTDVEPSYENVAVEEFGLAMLLGMGFNPATNTNKPKEYKRRAYDRAGLGADAHMKRNMATLTDASLMAKLKKDHMYHYAHDPGGPGEASCWVLSGLYVRVVERDHRLFGKKGIVIQVVERVVTLEVNGEHVDINYRGLETVVTQEATQCKVVRQIAKHSEKFYIPIGTVVDVAVVTKTFAKVTFRGSTFTVSLDDICEFR